MYHKVYHDICKLANRVNLDLISFGYAIVNKNWNGFISSPVYSRLYYVQKGSSSVKPKDGERTNLMSGKWYLMPSGCSFDYECSDEMEHYYFHLKITDFDGTDILRKCDTPLCCNSEDEWEAILKKSVSQNDILNSLLMKQTIFSIILKIISKSGINLKTENYSPCVMNAVKYIRENLSVQLTIPEIAKNIFVSNSTLTKHFKKELSMSVNEYIYNQIMTKAEHMLVSGNESVQSISEKFGFYDQFHFSRRFKEKFGQSPCHYRQKNPL